jgi:hypothetical protein
MSAMDFHPLADIFPMLGAEEIRALSADIRDHGLHAPIVTFEGKILDGRNRYNACGLAGVKAVFKEYEGDDPLGYVVSLNLKRRHLDASQRAMVATRIANMRQGNFSKAANLPVSPVSQEQAASMMNVSERSIRDARVVLDTGSPDMIAKVEHGELAVSAAANIVRESKPALIAAEQYAKWLREHFTAEEMLTILYWIEGTKPKDVIAALRRKDALAPEKRTLERRIAARASKPIS